MREFFVTERVKCTQCSHGQLLDPNPIFGDKSYPIDYDFDCDCKYEDGERCRYLQVPLMEALTEITIDREIEDEIRGRRT